VHTRAAVRAGESAQCLGVLAARRETELCTPRERAALALAEAVTHPADTAARDAAHATAREVVTDAELSAVVGARSPSTRSTASAS
jgi:alkylhydroperoxidase family enzyme